MCVFLFRSINQQNELFINNNNQQTIDDEKVELSRDFVNEDLLFGFPVNIKSDFYSNCSRDALIGVYFVTGSLRQKQDRYWMDSFSVEKIDSFCFDSCRSLASGEVRARRKRSEDEVYHLDSSIDALIGIKTLKSVAVSRQLSNDPDPVGNIDGNNNTTSNASTTTVPTTTASPASTTTTTMSDSSTTTVPDVPSNSRSMDSNGSPSSTTESSISTTMISTNTVSSTTMSSVTVDTSNCKPSFIEI